MNTLFSRLRKTVAMFSIGALLSTLVVVAPAASAEWYDAAVAALGDPSYQTMSADARAAALSQVSSRQDAAVVLHRALGSPAPTMTADALPFTDKADIAPYAMNAILFHHEEGVLRGNPDGTLRPQAGLNRAELVVILDRAGLLSEEMAEMNPMQAAEFAGAEWALEAFKKAMSNGIVKGYPDGALRPSGPVNKAETFVLAHRASGGGSAEPTEPTEPSEDPETPYDVTSPLEGGAGTINVAAKSAGTLDEVQEGSTVRVFSFEVEAKDSDVRLSNVRLALENESEGDSSKRLERYASSVTVYHEDNQVAMGSVGEFTKSGNVFSRSMPLSNAVVRQDDKVRFFVALTANENIDSADMEDADWTITASNFRFEDATGVVTTHNEGADVQKTGIKFEDLETSGQIELRFARGANNPDAGTVQVSRTAKTSNILLNEFTVKSTATLADFEELRVTVTAENVNDNGANNQLGRVVESVSLVRDGKVLDRQDIPNLAADILTTPVEFDVEDKLVIDEGETVTLQVVATVLSQQTGGDPRYRNGARVQGSISTAGHLVEDKNGDSIVVGNRKGSAAGELQVLYVDGINVELVSATRVKSTPGEESPDEGEFNIVVDVTAFGDDVYLDPTEVAEFYAVVTGAEDGADVDAVLTSGAKFVLNEDADGEFYEVREGTTERFTLTVSIIPNEADESGFYEVRLAAIVFLVGSPDDAESTYSSNLEAFRTGSINLVFRPDGL